MLVACDIDRQIRSIKVHGPLQNSRIKFVWDELRDIVPAAPIIICWCADKVRCRMRTECCEFHNSVLSAYYIRQIRFLLTSLIFVASRRGPRTYILLSRTRNLARGSDVDCLIRRCLKFCQLRAGFSGSLLGKKKRPPFVVIDTGQKGTGHALAIGELFAHSASITIAKKLIGSGTQSFRVVCQVGTFFFLRGDI